MAGANPVADGGRATGGNAGTGGATATGGNAGTGGATATGGNAGTGGATATGGNAGSATSSGEGGLPPDAEPRDAAQSVDASYPLDDSPNGLGGIDPDYVRDHFNELISGTWLVGWYGVGNSHHPIEVLMRSRLLWLPILLPFAIPRSIQFHLRLRFF